MSLNESSGQSPNLLELDAVAKQLGSIQALRGITLNIQPNHPWCAPCLWINCLTTKNSIITSILCPRVKTLGMCQGCPTRRNQYRKG